MNDVIMYRLPNHVVKLISTIIASLFGGAACTLLVLQYNPAIKKLLENKIITMFENSIECKMEGSLSYINFFNPTISLSNVFTRPQNANTWKWNCENYTLNFSWLHFLWYGTIDLHVTVENIHATSDIQNSQPTIMEHIQKIIEGIPQNVSIVLKSITFKKASLTIKDTPTQNNVTFSWSGESKIIGSSFKSHIYFYDGSVKSSNRVLFNQLAGTLECYIPKDSNEEPFVVRINCSLGLPYLSTNNKNCFLTGYFIKDHGLFSLQSVDGSLICGPLRLTKSAGNLIGEMHAKLPLSYFGNLFLNTQEVNDLNGLCVVHTKAYLNTTPYRLFGTISLYDVTYKNSQLSTLTKLSFNKQNRQWKGSLLINCQSGGLLEGILNYKETKNTGRLIIHNRKKISNSILEPWCIEPNNMSSNVTIDPQNGLTGTYNLNISQPKLHTNITVAGTASLNKNTCNTRGTINNDSYDIGIHLKPKPALSHFDYRDQDGNKLAQVHSYNDENTHLKGFITFPFIRSLVGNISQLDLQSQGILKFWSVWHSDHISVKAHLDHGTIRLPHTYNFINGFDAFATFNLLNKQITLNQIHCRLHKGFIQCNGATMLFNQNWKPQFMQIPLLIDSCLINNKDDLFAVISGSLIFTKENDNKSKIKGVLLVDRTQLKENIFSHLLKKDTFYFNQQLWNLYGDTIDCSLSIATQSPIRISTPFLEATAKVNLSLQQSLKNPELSGSIALLSGSINFPYKPLYITKAQFNFMPHQPFDPIIELAAKNKIKKYTITMSVNGSLQNHTIRLESAPPLNEEQIIALLLAGSEEESLSIVAPALIMQNIKNLIFNSSPTLTGLDSYVRNVFNPFKHIHLVPSFIDQSGRGGLRAAIEIDINERWHALIQKNFSLSEDTRFEVDYFLSDDICFKAVRDEHRDVSGQVEMRWKF